MSKTAIPAALRRLVAERFQHRCSYCQTSELIVGAAFTVDHILPEALGGLTVFENLCLACWSCNLRKGKRIAALDPVSKIRVRLFHPMLESWHEHFRWGADGLLIVGLTPSGRATIPSLNMNDRERVNSRRLWVNAGWHPPN
jgi:HNH endonuclease